MNIYHYVYQVRNRLNGHIYIGVRKSRVTPDHDTDYMGSGDAIKAAIIKHGIKNFEKIILSIHNTWQEALSEEAKLVTSDFVLREDTYNLTLGGFGGSVKGRTFSAQTRAKMSAAKKGKPGHPHTEESKRKLSESHKGKTMPPVTNETRLKLSESHKGLVKSEEHRKNLSIANTGKSPSAETRQKISNANKGKPSPHKGKKRPVQTPESNQKRSSALKGRSISEEQKLKISRANKGRVSANKGKPMSDEQKKKISETLKLKASTKNNQEKRSSPHSRCPIL